jgi:uncharacterized protein YycO
MCPKPNALSAVPQPRNPAPVALVLAGLLLPGGTVLLAWMFCRWLYRRIGGQAIHRRAALLVLVAFLQGCATQFDVRPGAAAQDAETAGAAPALHFQNLSAAPASETAFVKPAALQPGDILLSSMPGFAAAGIELMTVAPVSHASLYIGDGEIVEAVRAGVGTRTLDEVMAEETLVLVMRYPGLSAAQAQSIREYALNQRGAGFNFVGVTLHIPFSVTRRFCELPLVPSTVRDPCIRSMGVFHRMASKNGRFFCSQLVLQAYRHAGVQVTDADPRIVSPADLLHMREGDVPSFRIGKPLHYVGHLKYDLPMVAAVAR